MKPFYAEYSRYALGVWARSPDLCAEGASSNAWEAARRAVSGFAETDRAYLVALYGPGLSLAHSIPAAARRYHVPYDDLWQLARRAERRIAEIKQLV